MPARPLEIILWYPCQPVPFAARDLRLRLRLDLNLLALRAGWLCVAPGTSA